MAYFNYRNLDPAEFETLAKDVMERLLGCRLFRYGHGKDGGIDLCDDIREKHTIVQCKKYQQGSFDSLYSVLKREEKPKIDKLYPRPERYYVFTSIELLPQQKQKILNLFQGYMEEESCIVDGIAINEFFRDERNHDLIPRNIKLFISLPENYKTNPDDLLQIETNRLYDRLFSIFENDRKNHPSIRMMDPDPLLFPKGLPEILSDGRLAVKEKEEPRAIRDMILDSWKREDRRHILLVGEGGIGKTVAMLTLPVENWFKKLGIPVIYVQLQRMDNCEGNLNDYIKEKIGSENYERCINLAISTSREYPNLLLLLDGFNEIPDNIKKKTAQYIKEWMERPGIQIITTSRLGFFLENKFSKYRLQPLPYDTVRSFLLSAGIAEEQLPMQNDRIWEVINIPLMLVMYTQVEKIMAAANCSPAAPVLEWKKPENAAHIIWDYMQMELHRCIEKCYGRDDSNYSIMQYAASILLVAPYVCCQMSRLNKFYIKVSEFFEFIKESLSFYTAHQDMLGSQILNIRNEFDPYHEEKLFREENAAGYARILIDNIGLFQTQKISKTEYEKNVITDYTYSMMHQNFRDALAAFFICSCLPKTYGTEEKRTLLNLADHYVKDYMAEHLSDRELSSVWNKHRKEEPEDGHITFILMDLIGRQRNYDYRELDFSGIDLSKTNLHRLLSHRLDICPLPSDGNKLNNTKISVNCLSPNGHTHWVNSVAFSPDGRLLASGSFDKTVWIWNLESGESHVLESHTDGVNSVDFSPDGRQLAIGTERFTVQIRNLASGESRNLIVENNNIINVAFSPDGKHLAIVSGSYNREVRIWNLERDMSYILESKATGVSNVSFSPDGRQLAGGFGDHMVRIWNLASGESRDLKGHTSWVRSVAFSPDGRQLASGSDDKTVRIWDLESEESCVLEGHIGRISSVAFSPDGRQLTSGSDDKTVRIWDLASGESRVLEEHTGGVNSVAYNPDGRRLASGADDSTVRIWNLESGECRVLQGHAGWIFNIAYSPEGWQLISGAQDDTIRIWNLESRESRVLEGHTGWVRGVVYSPDGRQLASGSSDRTVRIWDLVSEERLLLKGHKGVVNSVVYHPVGRQLASGAEDGTVRIWDLESGEGYVLGGHAGGVNSVAYSPDGRQLASGSDDKTVRIWDLHSGEGYVLGGHAGGVNSVAFSPDGRQLASGSDDKTVRIWDLHSGSSRALAGHTSWVRSVAFSLDGRQLASGSSDKMVRIWDLHSGSSRALVGHTDWVRSVAFSPNGMYLASGADDSTVRIWDLDEYREVDKYVIITHINLSGANFERAIIDEKDKELLEAAGAKV